MTLGENIRYHRLMLGKKQLEVATSIGLSLPTYSRVENNQTKMDARLLPQLANALKTTVESLLHGDRYDLSEKERQAYQLRIQQLERELETLRRA